MHRILLFLFLFTTGFAGFAQQGPVYGQYAHNPFLYNPAFAGAEMYSVLTLTHQRQLLGIEGAPVASTLVFHTPVHKNIALGAKVYTESQGLLSSSAGQLALVYVLPLNKRTNLRFGLSGGLTRNQLDLSTATESQLAYLSGVQSSFNQLDIQFGIVLNNKRARIGISFPNMTKRELVSYTNYTQVELKPLEHTVFTGSYKLDLVPESLELEPMLIYEHFNSSREQRLEAGALLYMKGLVWVGGTYRHQTGMSGLLGIKLKESISFGYAYGVSSQLTHLFQNASHEVQLKIKLGKEKEYRKVPTHKPRFEI